MTDWQPTERQVEAAARALRDGWPGMSPFDSRQMAKAALIAAEQAAWEDIGTAPRDGVGILITDSLAPGLPSGRADKCWPGNTAVAAWWSEEGEGEGAWICYMSLPQDPEACFEPTHYRPLPAPPQESET